MLLSNLAQFLTLNRILAQHVVYTSREKQAQTGEFAPEPVRVLASESRCSLKGLQPWRIRTK